MQETEVRSLSWEDPLEKGMMTHFFLPGELHRRRSLAGYPWDHKQSHTTERLALLLPHFTILIVLFWIRNIQLIWIRNIQLIWISSRRLNVIFSATHSQELVHSGCYHAYSQPLCCVVIFKAGYVKIILIAVKIDPKMCKFSN